MIDEARRILNRVTNEADCDPEEVESGVVGLGIDEEWEAGSAVEDPEEEVDRHRRWESIEASIAHLGREQRALLLAYADGSSLAEIARVSGKTTSRLQSEMARITRQIRAHSPELRRLLRHEI